jgi:HPt (histidine-containing phosphotransfer) domain-containing protein
MRTKISFILGFTFQIVLFNAQRTFLLKYNVEDKKYDLYKESEAKSSDFQLVKKTKFKEGDVVRVKVENYNPFKYKVIIKQKEIRQKLNTESSLIDRAVEILGKSSVLGSFLTDNGLPLGSSRGFGPKSRGAEGSESCDQYLFAKPEGLSAYNSLKSQFQKDYKAYFQMVNSTENLIEQMRDAKLTSKEAFVNVKLDLMKLKDSLASFSFQQLLTEGQLAQNAFKEAKFTFDYKRAKDNVSKADANIKEETINEAYKHHVSDYQMTTMQYQELKEINDPSKRLTVDKINDLLASINKAEFCTEKVYVIHTDSDQSLRSSEGNEGVLSALDFEVEIYDIQKFETILNKEDDVRLFVRLPHASKYVNGYGEIVDEPCENCEPLVRAEGMISGEDIPSIEDIENNECDQCRNFKWTLYNKEGKIERIIAPAQYSVISGTPTELQHKVELAEGETLETALVMKKSLEMPVAGAVGLNWTTGLFAISPFGGRREFNFRTNVTGDSTIVSATNLSPLNLSLGTLMSIEFLSTRAIIPAINLGVSVDISTEQNINYLLGFSIKPKKFQLLSFAAGISYSKVNALNNDLKVGETYSTEDFNSITDFEDNFSKMIYRPGVYFGLGLNF